MPVLAAGPRDAHRRQRTLRATIDWSHELLTDAEQRLFARLAVFTGGCTLAAAEAVCDAQLDTLHALVDKSLVRADGERYRMLQVLREYALEKLDDANERHALQRMHAQWFSELCYSHLLAGYERRPITADLLPDLENFRAALESAAADGDFEMAARLTTPLAWFVWIPQGQLNEAERWLGLARHHLQDYPPLLHAQVLSAVRDVLSLRGEWAQAAALGVEALAIYRELGHVEHISTELMARGMIAAEQGDLEGDRAALEEAIRLGREHGNLRILPVALNNLGDVAIEEGRLDEARALCEESIACEAKQHPLTSHVALMNLAHVANLQGRRTDAIDLGRKAFSASLDRGDRVSAAAAANQIAWPLAEQGQLKRAGRLLGASLQFMEDAEVTRQRTDAVCQGATFNALRDQLDEQAVQALILRGRAMTLEDAARAEFTEESPTQHHQAHRKLQPDERPRSSPDLI